MLSPQNKQIYPKRHTWRNLTFLVAWLLLLGFIAVNRQDLLDWWHMRVYQPPAAVRQIAAQDTMTNYGRKVFYVNRPEIAPKFNFRDVCPNSIPEQTIVLGCYHSGQNGIYLLQITDTRLEGVEQVTAAHEMLHAAYERLSSKERKNVDSMLQSYYANGLKDERIKKTIDAYKQTEPNDLVNEMHSIFATEIPQLPAPLETYYQKYFTDRAKIAAYAARYQSEFTSRQQMAASYTTQIKALEKQIDAMKEDLKNKVDAINSRYDELLQLRNSGRTAEYNAAVPGYNNLVSQYQAEVRSINALVEQHNHLVSLVNNLANEQNQLLQELGSDVTPINN